MTGWETRIKDWCWKLLYAAFPPVELWRANRAIDRESRMSKYKYGLEGSLEDYSGDIDQFFNRVYEAHKSEIGRNSYFDSKAANYLNNIGLVLSILSIMPIFVLILGFDEFEAAFNSLPEAFIFLPLGYTVIVLLISAYYSTIALQARSFQIYFTADGMKEQVEEGEIDKREVIFDLLVAKKHNEITNLEKANTISVAQTLTRNGLFGLGIGLVLAVLIAIV